MGEDDEEVDAVDACGLGSCGGLLGDVSDGEAVVLAAVVAPPPAATPPSFRLDGLGVVDSSFVIVVVIVVFPILGE